ncbi:24499_t:CDS:2 [Gigaspora margarita]|uniref:24499_t:CDS:1 n=1 Tax=Gigaspora margarita TaxID=4874 RepID=A0ABM8W0H1_GIGMA|nr:24499_t:CDS:2 [Gigaspora margarita]
MSEFSKDTPECYIQFANQCIDVNSFNRPSASCIYDEFPRWYHRLNNASKMNRTLVDIVYRLKI